MINVYAGGFYRARDGYKYICVHELDSATTFSKQLIQVSNLSSVHVTKEGRATGDALCLYDMVSEVFSDDPLYVDPAAVVACPPSDMWERVEKLPSGFELHKFSANTSISDIKAADMPPAFRVKVDRNNVHKIWRCRAGRGCKWHYGWSKETAVESLLKEVSPRRGPTRT